MLRNQENINMRNTTQFSIPLAIFCFLTMIGSSAAADEFTGKLTATSNNVAAAPQTLTFKTVTGATSAFDQDIDVVGPPIGIAPIVLDMVSPASGLTSRLSTDAKAPADSITWTVNLRADHNGGTLTWDVSGIPDTYALSLRAPSKSTILLSIIASNTILVLNAADFSVGDTVTIGNEDLTISAINSNTLTVVRGVNNTTEDVHSPGASVTKTPVTDMRTQSSVNYIAVDGSTQSYYITAQKDLSPINLSPTVQTVAEDSSNNSITLSATDPEGGAVTYDIATDPGNGTATISGNVITYTPTANFAGTDTLTFGASDGTSTATQQITITVTQDNADAPVASDGTKTTDEDTTVSITLAAIDPDGDTGLTYSLVSQPSNGVATLSEAVVTYTPKANYNGNDTFTFNTSQYTHK